MTPIARRLAQCLVTSAALATCFGPGAAHAQSLTLVTTTIQTTSASAEPFARVAASADGRYVAFCSAARPTDMVPGRFDGPGTSNVYVRDRLTGTTELLTVAATDLNRSANGACAADVQITPDGRYVAFRSSATNLLTSILSYPPGEFSGFVHDRVTATTVLVDVAVDATRAAGVKAMVLSEDGRYVAFASAGSGLATQLITGFQDQNGPLADLYVRDLVAGQTRLVSREHTMVNAGAPVETLPIVSPRVFGAGGRLFFFTAAYAQILPNMSALRNLYAYDWQTDAIALVSVSALAGSQLPGDAPIDAGSDTTGYAVSADGRYAVFSSPAQLTVDATGGRTNVFVRDLLASSTTLVSVNPFGGGGNGDSVRPVISRDGAVVVFESAATDLVNGFTDTGTFADVFARARAGGAIEWISRAPIDLTGGNAAASLEDVSADGRYVSWRSPATNYLQPGTIVDGNGVDDIFVRDRVAQVTEVRTLAAAGNATANAASTSSTLLAGGSVAFFSSASNLIFTPQTTGTNIFAPGLSMADLSVTITDTPDPVAALQLVSYTYSAANAGPASATSVTISAPVPVGATFVTAEGGATPAGGVVTFTLGTLNPGASAARSMSVRFTSPGTGTALAAVTSAVTDPVPSNNTAAATTTVNNPLPRPAISGQVREAGNAPLPDVTVTLSGSASTTTTTGADGSYSFANLQSGASYTVTPSATGYVFTPPSASFASVTAAVRADFTGSCRPEIAGLVRDRLDGAVPGVTVSISPALVAPVVTDVDGRYAFTGLPLNQAFTLTASKPGHTFAPASQSITTATCGTTAATFVVTAGQFVRYFAEGAASDFFDTTIALLNVTGTPTTARLTYQTARGDNVVQDVPLGGFARATVNPEGLAGMTGAEFSTVVESSQPVIADRTMRWDASGYGSHAETAVVQPLTTWYLAEGATISDFSLFYLIQNPGDQEAQVQVTYLLPAPAQPFAKSYLVPRRSRQNVWVNTEDPRLAAAEVSAVITASVPVIVERAMYLSRPGQFFAAGHESAGVPGPAAQWFFAEGATGSYFDLFYLIANPGQEPAVIDGRYLLPDGTVLTKRYSVAGQSRFTVWADFETFEGTTGNPLIDTAVSASFTSVNGVGFIAERAMWWQNNSAEWFEGHNSAGALLAGTKWALADGEVGGDLANETYILIANVSSVDGTVRVTFVFEDGTTTAITRTVGAKSRTNVAVGPEVPSAAGKRFGALVESLGANPALIVVERAMYSDANGVRWAAGSNSVATRLR